MSGELDEKGLLPCPFCGGEPNVSTYETESLWSHDQVTYTKVECPECDIAFNSEPGYDVEAPEAWNRRAYLAASPSPSMEMEFTHVAKTKLDGLLADGWQVNGYSIQKDDRIGLVTTGAFVGWYSNACEAMNTAEAQVQRLTDENEALREKSDEFETGLVDFHRELSAAEARIKALEEARDSALPILDTALLSADPYQHIRAARTALKENAL